MRCVCVCVCMCKLCWGEQAKTQAGRQECNDACACCAVLPPPQTPTRTLCRACEQMVRLDGGRGQGDPASPVTGMAFLVMQSSLKRFLNHPEEVRATMPVDVSAAGLHDAGAAFQQLSQVVHLTHAPAFWRLNTATLLAVLPAYLPACLQGPNEAAGCSAHLLHHADIVQLALQEAGGPGRAAVLLANELYNQPQSVFTARCVCGAFLEDGTLPALLASMRKHCSKCSPSAARPRSHACSNASACCPLCCTHHAAQADRSVLCLPC